jgi:2-isopropylmalate synthase
MQIEFTRSIQKITDATGKEITAQQIFNEFSGEYLDIDYPFLLHGYESAQNAEGKDRTLLTARMTNSGEQLIVQGEGSGSLDAFVKGLRNALPHDLKVLDYHEHSKGTGVDATAVAYVEMAIDGKELWGCGLHTDITRASMRAIISAINRAVKES